MSEPERGKWYGWRKMSKGHYCLCTLGRETKRVGMRVVRRVCWWRTWGSVVKGADGQWWYEYQTVHEGSGKGWRVGKETRCMGFGPREALDRAKLEVERQTGAHTDWARKHLRKINPNVEW